MITIAFFNKYSYNYIIRKLSCQSAEVHYERNYRNKKRYSLSGER